MAKKYFALLKFQKVISLRIIQKRDRILPNHLPEDPNRDQVRIEFLTQLFFAVQMMENKTWNSFSENKILV